MDSIHGLLVERMRAALRLEHYSPRTERAYTQWIVRFVAFHGGRDPVRKLACAPT